MFNKLNELEKIVHQYKNTIAYKNQDESITYCDLWNKANNLATSLMCEGTSPVIIYGNKSINMIISIIACLIANRTYIPIDLHFPFDRIKKIIKFSHSSLLICNDKIDISYIKCMSVNEINDNYSKYEKFDTTSNNIAYIIFTSGSTGEPKGVPISYNNLDNFITWILKTIPNESNKRLNVLNQASFSFDLSVTDLYFSLIGGHSLIALSSKTQKDYDKIFRTLFSENINLMIITPTFIKLLMLNNEFNEKNYPELRCIYFCGEQLEVVTVQKIKMRFPNITIINAYGPTEATSAVCGIVINNEMLKKEYLPVGKINESATEIKIINNEIVLKGRSVFGGYLNISSTNCYVENNTNCYKTGDIGKIENNLLYCFGREDSQIKYMGYRIELGDIENNLQKIDGVIGAVVIAKYKENTKMVKYIKAFVEIEKDITPEYIKDELSKVLPNYMIPKTITILDKIPINNNGKYDRKKLINL